MINDLKLCIIFITLIGIALLLTNKSINFYLLLILAFCLGMFSESALNKISNIDKKQEIIKKG